jgi:hypothetical protein
VRTPDAEVVLDEVDAMPGQESVWVVAHGTVGDEWDAVRQRLYFGMAQGYAQVYTERKCVKKEDIYRHSRLSCLLALVVFLLYYFYWKV